MLVQNSFKCSVLAMVRIMVMKTEFISNPGTQFTELVKGGYRLWVDSKPQILKSISNGFCIFATFPFPFIHIQAVIKICCICYFIQMEFW